MMVIGAKYSHLRHTRRFSIVVLDRARLNLFKAIEADNRLIRDLQVVYSVALMCYTGLWCGNKRAFEIAESLRGTLRVCEATSMVRVLAGWAIPALLNLKSMFHPSEVAALECPCDDKYWMAPTARVWRGLLGSASLPPTPAFAVALAPFSILLEAASRADQAVGVASTPVLDLNPWSAFLVLLTLSSAAMDWSQSWALAVAIREETTEEFELGRAHVDGCGFRELVSLLEKRDNIRDAWGAHFTKTGEPYQPPGTGAYYSEASSLLLKLSQMCLYVQVTDLQDVLGKSGPKGLTAAMGRLGKWTTAADREKRSDAGVIPSAVLAVDIISLASRTGATETAAPYNEVATFLSHVLLWVFVTTATPIQHQQLLEKLRCSGRDGQLILVLETAMSPGDGQHKARSYFVLKHAAHSLAKMGTWGPWVRGLASVNI
ncbi:unnamed protein product [Parascedosporium putredinis]|uniref:Uncharacterized protein n=1 Tax=Parascedosporium putredinis TaxID=1442378 RepID=A0A9P1H5C9_9PEZI|nr:unnamed protein product [Parascedosporium putredinis]CAI7996341.1 unnamed protein product [Parascedosporium putredinis]